MPFIPALGRQRQVDLCELAASLVYRESARTGTKARETLPQRERERERENFTRIYSEICAI